MNLVTKFIVILLFMALVACAAEDEKRGSTTEPCNDGGTILMVKETSNRVKQYESSLVMIILERKDFLRRLIGLQEQLESTQKAEQEKVAQDVSQLTSSKYRESILKEISSVSDLLKKAETIFHHTKKSEILYSKIFKKRKAELGKLEDLHLQISEKAKAENGAQGLSRSTPSEIHEQLACPPLVHISEYLKYFAESGKLLDGLLPSTEKDLSRLGAMYFDFATLARALEDSLENKLKRAEALGNKHRSTEAPSVAPTSRPAGRLRRMATNSVQWLRSAFILSP